MSCHPTRWEKIAGEIVSDVTAGVWRLENEVVTCVEVNQGPQLESKVKYPLRILVLQHIVAQPSYALQWWVSRYSLSYDWRLFVWSVVQ